MRFLTGKTQVEQLEGKCRWMTFHNQLFQDKDGALNLVPRFYKTNGYTIPKWVPWVGGTNMELDIRPAVGHDFECEFHQKLIVNLPVVDLIDKGFLRQHTKKEADKQCGLNVGDVIWICEDIPVEFLSLEKSTFNACNSRFARMMSACGLTNFSKWLRRFAVNFNIGWLRSGKKPFNLEKIYQNNG